MCRLHLSCFLFRWQKHARQFVTRKILNQKNLLKIWKGKKCKNDAPILKQVVIRLSIIDLSELNLINSQKITANKKKSEQKFSEMKKKSKPLSQVVALSQAALFTSRAVRFWEKIKQMQNKNVSIDDLVSARMAGHRPWPAKIQEFKRNGTQVKFYGTNETGLVKKSEIIPYKFCQDVIAEYLKVPTSDLTVKSLSYHMLFIKATKEVSCVQQ